MSVTIKARPWIPELCGLWRELHRVAYRATLVTPR